MSSPSLSATADVAPLEAIPAHLLPPFTDAVDAKLRDSLKRCPPGTYEAARAFRQTGRVEHIHALLLGIIERYTERERRVRLATPDDNIRLIEDLGLDSLTLMEIVVLAEEVLPISINNEDMCRLRTLGDVKQQVVALMSRLAVVPSPTNAA